jgi:hypothetical protein
VDDILIVYKNGITNIQVMLHTFNKITAAMAFSMEEKVNNTSNINYQISPSLKTKKRCRLKCTEIPQQLTLFSPVTPIIHQNKN